MFWTSSRVPRVDGEVVEIWRIMPIDNFFGCNGRLLESFRSTVDSVPTMNSTDRKVRSHTSEMN
jgi:hypothetical protein